ncbi:aldehyde dehydrogenase family protein [Pseudomonas sp. BGr12]|uniref:aldehyde dehydrogenase family protein n=1 Tax=Pseudomonas sp. BGr12 TaxID=2936269 RepID=UPI002559FE14|nr:aldehyde dehydrogenase family protein [Pseudomonas sp. BJa5]MDL2428476.1 aldehyde dehydrogenase family protein [Pseudomonas sp. BJa5]
MTQYSTLESTRNFIDREHRMMINGHWCVANDGKTIPFHNPATGELLGKVPAASKVDVDIAVRNAAATFEDSEWSRMKPRDRQNLLWRLADLVERDRQQLAELETMNNGKLLSTSLGDVQFSIDFLRYMAGWATKIEGSALDVSAVAPPGEVFSGFIRREPIGVVGAIVAWNVPFILACWKLAPALATGCTLVLKPADETPLTALRLAELVLEAGFPSGVFNVITGTGIEAGAALASHPGVNKLTFTGSTAVGKQIGKSAMDNLARVTLELGGKSPVIVMPDANLSEAAQGAANAIFANQGQVCCAGSRLYVHRSVFENVVADVAAIAQSIKLGNGLDATSQMGPLISSKQVERVGAYTEIGRKEGAELLCGGRGVGPGYFFQPTVMVNVGQKNTVVQEEIFGPVLTALPFDTLDEVLDLANDTAYGLGASIWTSSLATAHRAIPKIKSGSVWVNCHTALDPALPFGGYKGSGLGREMGAAVIEHYTEQKSVLIRA